MELRKLLIGAAIALLPMVGGAQDYPNRPIRMVVPYAAGGGTDTVARLLAEKISDDLGQRVIVENKPGAATQLGTMAVVRAAPDGYTLLMGTANLATNVPLFAKLPYDAQKDLAPVSMVTKVPVYVFANAAAPIKNVRDLISRAEETKGGLSYATAGTGSIPHLAGEMFKTISKSNLVHIPFKGSAEATAALIGGQVEVSFDNLAPVSSHLKSGRVRAIGIAMPKRSELLPDVPTLGESGFPMEAYSWWGVLAPAGTPADIIDRLNKELQKALKQPDVREHFARLGIEPVGSSPSEFGAHIRAETVKWSKVAKEANIKPE